VIGAVNPYRTRRLCKPLNDEADFHGRISQQLLIDSQLPEEIPGTKLKKPETWY